MNSIHLNKIQNIFGKETNIIIGVIHFPPLPGYEGFPGLEVALDNALLDLTALQEGGCDAVFIENNYDIPHTEFVTPEVIEAMIYLGTKIKEKATIPLGVSVLWNDYKASFKIAQAIGAKFIRVPVFVDTVETDYGVIKGNSEDVISYQKSINATDIAIFTDIHVKHAKTISPFSLAQSAEMAVKAGSDALIITGKWTGDAPLKKDLEIARSAANGAAVFCGSGVDKQNIQELFQIASGAIVSTSLKSGKIKKDEVNMKPYDERISKEKVEELIQASSV